MKKLFFIFIFCFTHSLFSAERPQNVCDRVTRALHSWWNEDTGRVIGQHIPFDADPCEFNIFAIPIGSLQRRDVRRAVTLTTAVTVAGAIAFPYLAVPILASGGLAASVFVPPMLIYTSEKDHNKAG